MPRSEWIGKKLSNRYLIQEMVGQGGMSAVYKASDPNLKRVVAVKLIHSHLSADPDFVQRFEEEASAVAQLRHPHIIQVYDFNQDDGVYYMVLEFVPGENFQDHLRRLNEDSRRLNTSKVLEYMADICDAVDYAHRRGMIHRDIKPSNIMLNLMDEAILMDFGIAKIVGGDRHTATGAVVGTALYMSPEQIRGEHPDRRSDIYSLGVTLFEMVSGRPPFKADSAMTLMMMHINDPVPDPKKLNQDVPDDLVTVIKKALAKSPNERYQTAAEMSAALRKILSRLSSSPSAEMPAFAATMIEEMPDSFTSPDATFLEPPPANSEGMMLESKPQPTGKMSSSEALDRAAIESPVENPPPSTAPPGENKDTRGGTGIEGSVVRPAPPRDSVPGKSALPILVIAGIGVGLLCLLLGGIFIVNSFLNGDQNLATEPPIATVLDPTETATATAEQIVVPLATDTLAPTPTTTETPLPAATSTPDKPYAVITGIQVQGNLYVVDYVVHNFPAEANLHVHMFFNTIPPERAGSPAPQTWKLTWGTYGDPPFTQYGIANRPAGATQMCALVANPNHSVQLNSGNCIDLP